jgi:hypothetical protein
MGIAMLTAVGLWLDRDVESPVGPEPGPEAVAATEKRTVSMPAGASRQESVSEPVASPSVDPARETAVTWTGQPITVTVNESGEEVINIGEFLDADDPRAWMQAGSVEAANIGEYFDADDPAIWADYESREVINIGESLDPDDPGTWPASTSSEVVNIGEYVDLQREPAWSNDGEVINIGEYIDLGDATTPPQR